MDNQAQFIFRGESSQNYFMYIENDISFPSPERDVSFVEVLGRDGEVAIDNKRLKGTDFVIPVIVRPPNKVKLDQLATEITQWLKGVSGWHPLRFGSSPEYEYMAMITSQYDIQHTIMNHGRTVLTFRVKPYKRRIKKETIEVQQRTSLINRYGRESSPIIEVHGIGDITLMNNNKIWLQLRDVGDRVEIDSETMTIYRDHLPMYHKMMDLGRFPKLQPGINEITWTGRVSKLYISPRWESIL